MEAIRGRLSTKGFRCSKNQFTLLLRNPLYIGKILIPAWRDEPEELVDGLHEALVDELTYERVQERFTKDRYGRKQRGRKGNARIRPELVLRGHLLCPACTELLTGSRARGGSGHVYFYYHCHHCRGASFRADKAHRDLIPYLDSISPAREVQVLYQGIIADLTQREEMQRRGRLASLTAEHALLKERLFRTDEAFVEARISGDSYERLKAGYQEQQRRLRALLATLEEDGENFAEKLRYTISILSNLGKVYQRAPFEGKHALVGSIFPDKLLYHEGSFQTSPESEIIALFRPKNAEKGERRPSFDSRRPIRLPG